MSELSAAERFRLKMQAQGFVGGGGGASDSDESDDEPARPAPAYHDDEPDEEQSIVSYDDDTETETATTVSGTSYTSQSTAPPSVNLPAPHDVVSAMHSVFVTLDPRGTGRVGIAPLLRALQRDAAVRRFLGVPEGAELPAPRLPDRIKRADVTWEGFLRDFASAFTTRGGQAPPAPPSPEAPPQGQGQGQGDPDVVGSLNAYVRPLTALFAEYGDSSGALTLPGFHRLLSQRHVTPAVVSASVANAAFGDAARGARELSLPAFLRALAEVASRALCDVELLLARMDPEGHLFGPELLARRGEEARGLATRRREARWKAGMQAMKSVRRGPNLEVVAGGTSQKKKKKKKKGPSPAARAASASARDDTQLYDRSREHQETIERRTAELRQQLQAEEARELTFRPKINRNRKYEPQLSFAERQRQAEEARQLNLLRIRQAEFEKQEQATRKSVTLNPRSKKILQRNGRLFESTEERLRKLHRSRQEFFKDKAQGTQMIDETTGRPLFEPAVNRAPKTLHKDRHGTGTDDVAEALYRNAFKRKLRRQLAAQQTEEQEAAQRNQRKMTPASARLLRGKVEKRVRSLFGEFADEDTATLSFPRMGDVLRSVDCFRPSADVRRDTERLRRLWDLLVADAGSGLTLPALLWFVGAVACGDDGDPPAHLAVDAAAAAALVREFRDEHAQMALARPTRQQELGFRRAKAVDQPVDPECTFQPAINERSRNLSRDDDDLPTTHRLAMTRALTEKKLEAARREKERAELATCTFQPHVNDGVPRAVRKAAAAAAAVDSGSEEPDGPEEPEEEQQDGAEPDDRAVAMYEDFLVKRATEERRRKAGLIKTTDDRDFEENCTFHPTVNPAPPRPEPRKPPKGFERDVERMRQAAAEREMRRLEADLIGHGRVDVDAHRNKRGHIARGVKPFNLQTDKRSARRQQQRRQEVESERQQETRERRAAASRRAQDHAAAMAAAAEAEAEAKLRDAGPPLLFVDVNIAPGRSERVAVWHDDDPGRIARDFCARHMLGPGTAEKLRAMLTAQMEHALGHKISPRAPMRKERRKPELPVDATPRRGSVGGGVAAPASAPPAGQGSPAGQQSPAGVAADVLDYETVPMPDFADVDGVADVVDNGQ